MITGSLHAIRLADQPLITIIPDITADMIVDTIAHNLSIDSDHIKVDMLNMKWKILNAKSSASIKLYPVNLMAGSQYAVIFENINTVVLTDNVKPSSLEAQIANTFEEIIRITGDTYRLMRNDFLYAKEYNIEYLNVTTFGLL